MPVCIAAESGHGTRSIILSLNRWRGAQLNRQTSWFNREIWRFSEICRTGSLCLLEIINWQSGIICYFMVHRNRQLNLCWFNVCAAHWHHHHHQQHWDWLAWVGLSGFCEDKLTNSQYRSNPWSANFCLRNWIGTALSYYVFYNIYLGCMANADE